MRGPEGPQQCYQQRHGERPDPPLNSFDKSTEQPITTQEIDKVFKLELYNYKWHLGFSSRMGDTSV